jgi:hypothetical protein
VAFVHPARPTAFNDTINTTKAVLLVSKKSEKNNKAVLANRDTYRAMTTESNNFCEAVVGSISSLSKKSPTHFTEATACKLLDAVWKVYTGLHVINMFGLQETSVACTL